MVEVAAMAGVAAEVIEVEVKKVSMAKTVAVSGRHQTVVALLAPRCNACRRRDRRCKRRTDGC